ncbi:hypothetical protein NL676_023772, partial [Syzygium grande]
MHDLIQLMGMDIVKQECRDDPRNRIGYGFVVMLLMFCQGYGSKKAVKAIVLDLPKPEEIDIGSNAFTNMRRLRLLIMINVQSSFRGPIYLCNELRWFEWPGCPPWIPEFGAKKLVGLDQRKSNIQIAREQFK